MVRCPHNRVQQFTEMCLDCGRNIYETDEQYLKHLQDLDRGNEIERLEKKLGINNDDWYPNKYPDM